MQCVAQQASDRASAWFSGGQGGVAQGSHAIHGPVELGRGSGTVDAFEDDELSAHGPSSTTNLGYFRVPAGLYSPAGIGMFRTVNPRVVLVLLLIAAACKRSAGTKASQPAGTVSPVARDVLCMEQPEGCVYCSGRDLPPAPFLDSDQPRPITCDPKDDSDCVEFCTVLAPECALPWVRGARCVFKSELEFQRAVFNRDTSDRPEVQVVGKLVDENGRRVEGARVDVWVARGTQQTALAEEFSGKDGTFRLHLRSGPWTYSLRFSRAGLATQIVDHLVGDKLALTFGSQPRVYRLGSAAVIKGRVVENSPELTPVADAEVAALRAPDEGIESSSARTGEDGSFVMGGLEGRRYYLRITKFGWRPLIMKGVQAGTGGRLSVKLARATVIRGLVKDKDGDPEPDATVAAVLSDIPGTPVTSIFWTTDSAGSFAQDRFSPGTYYLWARKGDMLAYPPEKIELPEGGDVEVVLTLQQKGSRVKGQVVPQSGLRLSPDTRVLLISRSSPLAFPRPAVTNLEDASGRFELAGMLPGRYEISVRDGTKSLAIVAGPSEVEIPIDADVTVPLKEPITVRPRVAE